MRPVRTKLPFADQKTLWQAVCVLERESFVARVSALSGEPVTQLLKVLPSPVTRQINRAVQGAMQKALDLALYRLDSGLPEPGEPIYKIASGVTGGVGGFFGLATLTVELPVTTTLMLRSIAGIARRHGEDLTNPASRLACLEVFALGPQDRNPEAPSAETSYFAVRSFLAKAVGEAADAMAQRAIAQDRRQRSLNWSLLSAHALGWWSQKRSPPGQYQSSAPWARRQSISRLWTTSKSWRTRILRSAAWNAVTASRK